MGEIVRFGVSMDEALVAALDRLTGTMGHANRSQTIRDLVRQEIIKGESVDGEETVVATATLTYRYGTKLPRASVQDFPSVRITTNIQVHVDENICVKVMIVTGKSGEIHSWAKKLLAHRSIIARLHITATTELYRELRDDPS